MREYPHRYAGTDRIKKSHYNVVLVNFKVGSAVVCSPQNNVDILRKYTTCNLSQKRDTHNVIKQPSKS